MVTLLKPGSIEYPEDVGKEIIPVSYVLDFIGRRLNDKTMSMENRILFLKAMTASGKSTTIPPLLYTEFTLGLYKFLARDIEINRSDIRKIICTQPRIYTAQDIPINIVKDKYYHPFKMGYDIGYQTGIATERPIRMSGLLFCTLQVLTQQLKIMSDDTFMSMYKFIIIDEAHERSIALDTTLFELKNFMKRNAENSKCPYVIIMSATFDPDHYARYFEVDPAKTKIVVRGYSFPVETHWPKKTIPNFAQGANECIKEIVKYEKENPNEGGGNILIFIPGIAAATAVTDAIKKTCIENNFRILNINREAQNAQTNDFRLLNVPIENMPHHPKKKVIIGTNIVETGATLPDLKYVIDCGWSNISEYNPWYNIEALVLKPAAQSMILQRRGRVGRKGPGIFYPLYPEEIFKKLVEIQFPDIIREDCTELVLDIIARLCIGHSEGILSSKLDMLDNPGAVALNRAYFKLVALGFIREHDSKTGSEESDDIKETEQKNDDIKETEQKNITEGEASSASVAEVRRTEKAEPAKPWSTEGARYRITNIGRLASKLTMKLSVEDIKMIMSGYAWGISIIDLVVMGVMNQYDTREFLINNSVDPKDLAARNLEYSKYEEVLEIAFGVPKSKYIFEYYNMLFCDEFINNLVIYTAFKKKFRQESYNLVRLKEWADKTGIVYDGMVKIIQQIDETINNMILAGMNIFYNYDKRLEVQLVTSSIQEYKTSDLILGYKQCIYEGFKLNVALWNSEKQKYVTREGLEFSYSFYGVYFNNWKKDGFTEKDPVIPHRIIYDSLALAYKRHKNRYDVNPGRISIMDGFIFDDPYLI